MEWESNIVTFDRRKYLFPLSTHHLIPWNLVEVGNYCRKQCIWKSEVVWIRIMLVATVISLKITKYINHHTSGQEFYVERIFLLFLSILQCSPTVVHIIFCSFLSYGISVAPRWDARIKSDEELSITEGQKRAINIMECF